jgi:hypothetical protein
MVSVNLRAGYRGCGAAPNAESGRAAIQSGSKWIYLCANVRAPMPMSNESKPETGAAAVIYV